MSKLNLTGQRFGRLVAKEIAKIIPGKGCVWKCECDCGGEKEVPASYLLNGHTRSCGCLKTENLDITGKRWGRLVAIRQVGYTMPDQAGKRQAVRLWRCDCGNEKEIPATQVKHGGTRSCGCKAVEHTSSLRKENITGFRFGKLTAVAPTPDRDKSGGVVWKLNCDCGNIVYKTVNALKSGRVLSCGCLYAASRFEISQYRKDFVEETSLSSIVASKRVRSNNTSGHTGVWFDKKNGRWNAYINYQKKRIYLGSYAKKEDAIRARRTAEIRVHDPVVLLHWNSLTESAKAEFSRYLRSTNLEGELKSVDSGFGSSC